MDDRLELPVNTPLVGSYRIMRVVASGGFGITYEAEDTGLGAVVAIKEYYPFDFGDRDPAMSVGPKSERHKQTFEWGRANFLREARTLARFDHPSIVRVTRVFEANATAYMVMRFEHGLSLEAWLAALGRPPTQEQLDGLAAPLLDALQIIHAADFLHGDIAPDNVLIRADGTPVLLDFGSARRAVAQMSRSVTGIVKAGYSPHEQYSSDGRLLGPWSDIYALGGTLYRAVAGHPPEEATLRMSDDRMVPMAQAAQASYRPGFLNAIDWSLSLSPRDRPGSIADWRKALLGGDRARSPPHGSRRGNQGHRKRRWGSRTWGSCRISWLLRKPIAWWLTALSGQAPAWSQKPSILSRAPRPRQPKAPRCCQPWRSRQSARCWASASSAGPCATRWGNCWRS